MKLWFRSTLSISLTIIVLWLTIRFNYNYNEYVVRSCSYSCCLLACLPACLPCWPSQQAGFFSCLHMLTSLYLLVLCLFCKYECMCVCVCLHLKTNPNYLHFLTSVLHGLTLTLDFMNYAINL